MLPDYKDYSFLKMSQHYVYFIIIWLGNSLTVPDIYVKNGLIGDLGVIVGNEENSDLEYVAKSNACAVLQSNNRPIWGSIMFNNAFLEFNQVGFQQNLYVGVIYSSKFRFMKWLMF